MHKLLFCTSVMCTRKFITGDVQHVRYIQHVRCMPTHWLNNCYCIVQCINETFVLCLQINTGFLLRAEIETDFHHCKWLVSIVSFATYWLYPSIPVLRNGQKKLFSRKQVRKMIFYYVIVASKTTTLIKTLYFFEYKFTWSLRYKLHLGKKLLCY